MPPTSSSRPLPPPRTSFSATMKPLPPIPTPRSTFTPNSPPPPRPNTILLALTSLLLFLFLSLSLLPTLRSPTPPSPSSLSSNTKHPVRFTDYHTFLSPLDGTADTAWASLIPPNGGYVYKNDVNGERREYGISMFHQLHCLQLIRKRLISLDPSYSLPSPPTKSEPKPASPLQNRRIGLQEPGEEPEGMHWTHCVDYLRQSILCAADDTIEVPVRQPGGKYLVDANSEHMCLENGRLWDLSVASGFLLNGTEET